MNKIKRTIDLIKKTQNHPAIFHILYSNLCHLKKTERTFIQTNTNLFTNILLASTDDPRTNFHSLEAKILSFLKESRKAYDSLKLRIILYYLEGRFLSKINCFILFELMMNHYGQNSFNDWLIEQILSKSISGSLFGIKGGKKIQNDAIILFLKEKTSFSLRLLPSYCFFDICPPLANYENEGSSLLLDLKVAESLSFYGKYTKNVNFFKQIVPQTEEFRNIFRSFILNDFLTEKEEKSFSLANLLSDENEEINLLFYKIKKTIEKVKEKEKIKSMLINYIEALE